MFTYSLMYTKAERMSLALLTQKFILGTHFFKLSTSRTTVHMRVDAYD